VHVVCRQFVAQMLVTDRVQYRAQAVSVLPYGLRRRAQALSEPGLGALPDSDLGGKTGFRPGVGLSVELLFQFPDLVADLGLGPAIDPLANPPAVRVEPARHLTDEALARLQPEDRVLAPAAPSHDLMLALTILDGYHYGYRPPLPEGRNGR
jgi:hypothetical protein